MFFLDKFILIKTVVIDAVMVFYGYFYNKTIRVWSNQWKQGDLLNGVLVNSRGPTHLSPSIVFLLDFIKIRCNYVNFIK